MGEGIRRHKVDERLGVGGGGVDGFVFSSRRRHTRYWRDWSSVVCSSDLPGWSRRGSSSTTTPGPGGSGRPAVAPTTPPSSCTRCWAARVTGRPCWPASSRSEERRVGKECRSRWSPDHSKKKHEPYQSGDV